MNLNIFQFQSLRTRVTVLVLAMFVLGIWGLSYYASRMLREDLQQLLSEQQFSTVSLLARQVNDELAERLTIVGSVAALITPAMLGKPADLQALLDERPSLPKFFNGGVTAFGLDGTAIADVPLSAGRIGVNFMDMDVVAAAINEGKSTFGRPVMGKKLRAPVFAMAAPVRDPQGKVIGALAGVIDLSLPNFLDRTVEGRYAKTGGYGIVASPHRQIVTATNKGRVMEVLPAPGIIPEVDRILQGRDGSAIYVNPFGVEVLASAKGIAVAGWTMFTVLPTAEAFAPIRDLQRRILLATILLTLLAGGLVWWTLRRQLAPMLAAARTLATLPVADQPPQPLPVVRQDEVGDLIGGFNRLLTVLAQREEALKRDADRFRILTEMTSDFYWETDAEHRFTAWSAAVNASVKPVWRVQLGQRRWELPSLSPEEAGWQAHRATLEARQPFREFELSRLGDDGGVHYLSLSGDPVFDASGAFRGYDGVGSDITERKRFEQALQSSLAEKEVLMREIHHRVKNNLQMMSALLELQAGYLQDEEARAYFADSQQRIQSMAMVHAQLYKNQEMAQIDFAAYLRSLVDLLRGQYAERCAQVAIRVDAQACTLPVDTAIPCGLVVTELVANAMKHAFPGNRAGELRIGLRCGGQGKVILEVADDGVGLPAAPEAQGGEGFGMRVVRLMVEEQLHGKLRIQTDHGTCVVCEMEVQQ